MPLSTDEYKDFMSAVVQIRDLYNTMAAELKKYGQESGESKARQDRIETVLQQYEAKMQQPLLPSHTAITADTYTKAVKADRSMRQEDVDRRMDIVRELPSVKAFIKSVRAGYQYLSGEERKLIRIANAVDAPGVKSLPGVKDVVTSGMTITEETTGGMFAPPEYVAEIIKNLVLYSPVRSWVRVRPTSNRSVQMPKRTNNLVTAQWVGERTVRTDQTGWTVGRLEIPTNEMYGLVLISEQDLEDTEFDVEAEIRSEISEQFGVAEGKALLSGDGSSQPQGILTNSSVLSTDSAANTGPDADSLIDCLYALPSVYAANATWYFNRSSIALIRKLKYTGGEQSYIWQPGAGPSANGLGAAPNTILGVPYQEVPDMPTNAANTVIGVLGDLQRAYVLVDRVGMTFKRLTERWVENSQIGVYARRRLGGQVVLPEAIRFYKVKA